MFFIHPLLIKLTNKVVYIFWMLRLGHPPFQKNHLAQVKNSAAKILDKQSETKMMFEKGKRSRPSGGSPARILHLPRVTHVRGIHTHRFSPLSLSSNPSPISPLCVQACPAPGPALRLHRAPFPTPPKIHRCPNPPAQAAECRTRPSPAAQRLCSSRSARSKSSAEGRPVLMQA
jgi:hypothetical protein